MNHKSDVLFVDAEAERYRCYDHMHLVFHPFLLDVQPLLVAQSGMIKFTLYLEFPFQN